MKNFYAFSGAILLYTLAFIISPAVTERVVIFHGVSSWSHRVQTFPIAEVLSKRGYEVTYMTPLVPRGEPHPNITDLVPKAMVEYVESFLGNEFDIRLRVNNKMPNMYPIVFEFGYTTCEVFLKSPEFGKWFEANKNKKFDLFIVDSGFSECGIGLAHRLGAKVIIFSTVVPIPFEYDAYGHLPESSAIPELENNPPATPMGFFDRVSNAIASLKWRYQHCRYAIKVDELIRTSLALPNMPFIGDLMRNVSLIFYTGDVISDHPRTLPPLFVNVAGTHCRESTKALPKEIESFINGTKPGQKNVGFVYISLGSLVVSSNLPDNIKQVFFDVIKAFPEVKFLWKWNGDFPKDIPENLFLSKWFPQVDVLGHPKILGFVTQSGRPSTLEATYLGVPMISFPVLGDQDMNANRMHEMGATIKLEIATVTFPEFRDAVAKVVYDPSVKSRMKRIQSILRDQPMTPVQTAIWWIDYVLRHEDTSHLRPAGNEQYWFVRRQVDVWAFLSIGSFLVLCTVLKIATMLLKLTSSSKSAKQVSNKKKKL